MTRHSAWFSLVMAAAMSSAAQAQPQVDLSVLDRNMVGPRTQLLVLGSVHLSQLPEDAKFKPESLEPVLQRLVAYKPDIITVEALSGETCDLMARHPVVYAPDDVKTYCRDTSDARAATGLDLPTAIAEVRRMLKDWPAEPTAQQRRRLAALFLATGDSSSALVQWWQLAVAERRAGDGIDDALLQQLRKLEGRNNENFQIAARVAVRLGLQRVYPVDDHTGDNIDFGGDIAAYGKAIQAQWDGAAPRAKPMREREAELARQGDMLALYRAVNATASQQLAIEVDFGAALGDRSPQHYGQRYVAGWEARNLRMVSNIRAAAGDHPGARVLSIVGASHKPWFDSLLGQMQGVEIVDAEQVLK